MNFFPGQIQTLRKILLLVTLLRLNTLDRWRSEIMTANDESLAKWRDCSLNSILCLNVLPSMGGLVTTLNKFPAVIRQIIREQQNLIPTYAYETTATHTRHLLIYSFHKYLLITHSVPGNKWGSWRHQWTKQTECLPSGSLHSSRKKLTTSIINN